MLELNVSGELFDELHNEFIPIGPKTIRFEHSLLSLSEWESKWRKPFLDDSDRNRKTSEEIIDYFRCMALDPISDNELTLVFSEYFDQINDYIESNHTATTISRPMGHARRSSSIVTSELIYYWMFSAGIPAEPCERWNLSRLITLIEIFGIKNSPKKKMSRSDVSSMYRSLNAKRRAKLGTSG